MFLLDVTSYAMKYQTSTFLELKTFWNFAWNGLRAFQDHNRHKFLTISGTRNVHWETTTSVSIRRDAVISSEETNCRSNLHRVGFSFYQLSCVAKISVRNHNICITCFSAKKFISNPLEMYNKLRTFRIVGF